MQQVRALRRVPKESQGPKERRLARALRKARATGLMTYQEQGLASIAAADKRKRATVVATECVVSRNVIL